VVEDDICLDGLEGANWAARKENKIDPTSQAQLQ
jgi:hypothetical protein